MPTLILASGSPRRRDLLTEAGFEFVVDSPSVAESASVSLSMRELTILNATRKALFIAKRRADAVVLAADTLVALEGKCIGKPVDLPDANKILQRLQGRTHQVCTGVYLCAASRAKAVSFSIVSQVRFRKLSPEAIASYLRKIDPLDKAGAYAAQGDGAEIIAQITGSFSNVVGLPIEETIRALRSFGVRPRSTCQDAGVRQQISSLLPSGSSKKKA